MTARADVPAIDLRDLREDLPLVDYLAARHLPMTTGALAKKLNRLLTRITTDGTDAVLRTPELVGDAVALLLGAVIHDTRHPSTPASRRLLVQAGALIHAAGVYLETEPGFNRHMDALLKDNQKTSQREKWLQLKRTLPHLREVGRSLFSNALHRALRDTPDDILLHHLRGQWLLREGRWKEALVALASVIRKDKSVRVATDVYRALLMGNQAADARQVAARIVATTPGKKGLLATIRKHHDARRKLISLMQLKRSLSAEEWVSQFDAHLVLHQNGKAERLLKEALTPDKPHIAMIARAFAYYANRGDLTRLHALIVRIQKQRPTDPTILHARIALNAQRLFRDGGKMASAHRQRFKADLTRYTSMAGPEDMQLAWAMVLLMKASTLRSKGTLPSALRTLMKRGITRWPHTILPFKMTLGIMFTARLPPGEILKHSQTYLRFLKGKALAQGRQLLGQLLIGYGIRNQRTRWIDHGLSYIQRMKTPSPTGAVAKLLGELARDIITQGRSSTDTRKRILNALSTWVDRFDENAPSGREQRAATFLSLGTLAWSLHHAKLAWRAWRFALQANFDSGLSQLSGGLGASQTGDLVGAGFHFTRGLRATPQPALRFLLKQWLGVIFKGQGRKTALKAISIALLAESKTLKPLALKEAVNIVPFFSNTFSTAIRIKGGHPRIEVLMTPLLILAPAPRFDREEVTKDAGLSIGKPLL
jgi:tetratricopeptide (TPR) repeat protein